MFTLEHFLGSNITQIVLYINFFGI